MEEDWTATALNGDDILHIPEIGIEIPVPELYEGVDFTVSVDDIAQGGATPSGEDTATA